MRRFRLRHALLGTLLAGLASSATLPAQGLPDKPENLKVLSKRLTTRQVVDSMRAITSALGVRCVYCHVGIEGFGLDSVWFKKDDRIAKRKARAMMQMVAKINRDLLPRIPERSDPPLRLQCITCHRGSPRPLMLEDTLGTVVEKAGADSAVALYRALRERYYGRFAYDFGERSLNVLAARLSAAERLADARRMLELNAELFPESGTVAFELGRIYEGLGERDLAIASYQRAVRLQPRNPAPKERLKALGVETQ
jgi:photosynthetic reaction center cytochrome c subunit